MCVLILMFLNVSGLLVVPDDCSRYNPKFEGDPDWAMSCAGHAIVLFCFIFLVRFYAALYRVVDVWIGLDSGTKYC